MPSSTPKSSKPTYCSSFHFTETYPPNTLYVALLNNDTNFFQIFEVDFKFEYTEF